MIHERVRDALLYDEGRDDVHTTRPFFMIRQLAEIQIFGSVQSAV